MPKYFEYKDKTMEDEVKRLVNEAHSPSPDVKSDKTIDENNNRDKPFQMTEEDFVRRCQLAETGGRDGRFVVSEHRKEHAKLVEKRVEEITDGFFGISNTSASEVAKVIAENAKGPSIEESDAKCHSYMKDLYGDDYEQDAHGQFHLSDMGSARRITDEIKDDQTVWDKIKSWLPGNSEAKQKRILLGVKKKIAKQDEKMGDLS